MGAYPSVDEAFYYGFCGGRQKTPQQQGKVNLSSVTDRREFMETLI